MKTKKIMLFALLLVGVKVIAQQFDAVGKTCNSVVRRIEWHGIL